MTTKLIRVILYKRLSELRREDLTKGGLDDQERLLREMAQRRGWPVVDVITENDIDADGNPKSASAWKRKRVILPNGESEWRVFRPGYRTALAKLAAGEAEALLGVDLDRVARDNRDMEDLIDVTRMRKLNVDSLTGSLRFTNGGTETEFAMARVMVTFAQKSSADTAGRVSRARFRDAMAGKFGGGKRPYGFDEDGLTPRWDEYEIIREAAREVLLDVSLNLICHRLDEVGAPTADGAERWHSSTLKAILLRPRNIARIVHQSKAATSVDNDKATWLDKLGVIREAQWPRIFSDEVFQALQATLCNPNRRTNHGGGPTFRWLGSGIYRCGHCGALMEVHAKASQPGRRPVYRCRVNGGGCPTRSVADLDEWVIETLISRLSRDDAVNLLPTDASTGVDREALQVEIKALRQRKLDLGDMFENGEIDRAQFARTSTRLQSKIDSAQQTLNGSLTVSPLAPLVAAQGERGVREAWDRMSLGTRREVVKALMTVTILPGVTGRTFDPAAVKIAPAVAA
jgi:DNA invertase Pin-like site-specific DNA recombinase